MCVCVCVRFVSFFSPFNNNQNLPSGVRSTTENIARIGKPSNTSANATGSTSSVYHQDNTLPGTMSAPGNDAIASGAGGDLGGGGWDAGVGQVRPRRVLYGPERALRAYAIEDARAAAFLRVSEGFRVVAFVFVPVVVNSPPGRGSASALYRD